MPTWGRVEVFCPFASCPAIVFARTAARSHLFAATPANQQTPIIVGACAGCDEADVTIRARNELIERVSNVLAGRAAERAADIIASYAQLRRHAKHALDPAAWGPIELRDAPLLWVTGRSLIDQRDVLVPAGTAFMRHRPPPGSPALRTGSTGLAAHSTTTLAIGHALRELLERDLIARSWYETGRSWTITAQHTWPPPLTEALNALELQASRLVLPGPRGTGCAVTCLHTPDQTKQSFGARCITAANDLTAGFERAAYEALMIRWSMHTPAAHHAYKAMRARPQQPPLPTTALEHALWTYHHQDSLKHWQDTSTIAGELGQCPQHQLATAVAEHTNDDIIAIDSTTTHSDDDIAVVRIVAPGARRLPTKTPNGHAPHPLG